MYVKANANAEGVHLRGLARGLAQGLAQDARPAISCALRLARQLSPPAAA